MRTIHKYILSITDTQRVRMPMQPEMLHVDIQHGRIVLWAIVDTTFPKVDRVIHVVGTGHPCQHAAYQHLGTVQLSDYVWHVFDGGPDGRGEPDAMPPLDGELERYGRYS